MTATEKMQKFAEVYKTKRAEVEKRTHSLVSANEVIKEACQITGNKFMSLGDAAHFLAYRSTQKELSLI